MATEAVEVVRCAVAYLGESRIQVEECRQERASAAATPSRPAAAAPEAWPSVAFAACGELDGAAPEAPETVVAPW